VQIRKGNTLLHHSAGPGKVNFGLFDRLETARPGGEKPDFLFGVGGIYGELGTRGSRMARRRQTQLKVRQENRGATRLQSLERLPGCQERLKNKITGQVARGTSPYVAGVREPRSAERGCFKSQILLCPSPPPAHLCEMTYVPDPRDNRSGGPLHYASDWKASRKKRRGKGLSIPTTQLLGKRGERNHHQKKDHR